MKKETKKINLEEIDVMQGIDFKANQERMREEIKRIKKEQKKETILFYFIAAVILLLTVISISKTSEQFVNNCTSKGYSESYCISKA